MYEGGMELYKDGEYRRGAIVLFNGVRCYISTIADARTCVVRSIANDSPMLAQRHKLIYLEKNKDKKQVLERYDS